MPSNSGRSLHVRQRPNPQRGGVSMPSNSGRSLHVVVCVVVAAAIHAFLCPQTRAVLCTMMIGLVGVSTSGFYALKLGPFSARQADCKRPGEVQRFYALKLGPFSAPFQTMNFAPRSTSSVAISDVT